MGIEEFDDMFSQEVTVEPFTGTDEYGNYAYGDSVSYQARVVGKTRVVRNSEGEESVSTHTVYLKSTSAFTPKDRITLPAGYSPQQPIIISVGTFPDESGLHHKVIYLQ